MVMHAHKHTLFIQMEFIVIVNSAGKVVTAAHNSALNGTAWNPANIVSDVLSTGNVMSHQIVLYERVHIA
jgi:hypothetical protein